MSRNSWYFHLLGESHVEMFTIDAHALLNERLGLLYLLYKPPKSIKFSDKLRINFTKRNFCKVNTLIFTRKSI